MRRRVYIDMFYRRHTYIQLDYNSSITVLLRNANVPNNYGVLIVNNNKSNLGIHRMFIFCFSEYLSRWVVSKGSEV